MNPTWAMYVLHSLQGHASGLPLVALLNVIWHKLPDFWAKISYGLYAKMNSFYVFSPKLITR